MSRNLNSSTRPKTRSRGPITTSSDDGDSQDESLPLDVTQMRANFEETPGRLPLSMAPLVTPASNVKCVSAIDPLRDRLEVNNTGDSEKRISPGLRQLRKIPVSSIENIYRYTISKNLNSSTRPQTRSRGPITTSFDDGDSQDESLPLDVTQMRAHFEKTPGRLPISMAPLVTPASNVKCVSAIDPLRDRLEVNNTGDSEKRISPGLRQLRKTPGQARQKQKLLTEKFHAAKSNAHNANVGGGVSIWPDMENMRLTSREVWELMALCIMLVVAVYVSFKTVHGNLISRLEYYNHQLKEFPSQQAIDSSSQDKFHTSLLHWHMEFSNLMDSIHSDFDIDWYSVAIQYQLLVALYLAGIGVLFYFLFDNMYARNKLTPWRIKNWVSVLVVIGCWSILTLDLLAKAQRLEFLVERNVRILSNQLGSLVFQDLDLERYNNVLHLWHTRCLPPTTLGTLSIMGIFQVRDVSYYLQYYSLPLLTALLTPVVRLIMALNQVYKKPKYC